MRVCAYSLLGCPRPHDPHAAPFSLQLEGETIMNQEKLTKLQAQVHIGGKGTADRKEFTEQL